MKKRRKLIAILMALSVTVIPVHAEEISIPELSTYPDDIMTFSVENSEDEIQTESLSDIGCSSTEWFTLHLTNLIREDYGLDPLSVTAPMQNAAHIRANELPSYFSHTRPNGTICYTALEEAGVPYFYAAENIAAGRSTPEQTLIDWMNSDGHRKNILSSEASHLAIGQTYSPGSMYGNYWVQMFVGNCSPSSIAIDQTQEYTYLLDKESSLNDLGIPLTFNCEHGTSYLPVTEKMCSNYDYNNMNDVQTVTVTYKGCTTTFNLLIVEPMTFQDVYSGAWYYDAVENVYYNHIMTGLNSNQFGVNEPLARAQFAVILHRLSDKPSVSYSDIFPDVPANIWYTDAVLWANSIQVINGYSDTGMFGPNDHINREQMVVMMYRYAQYLGANTAQRADISNYRDASNVNSFATEAMQWAVASGIISGKDNGTKLDPQGNASRAECAKIITNFIHNFM